MAYIRKKMNRDEHGNMSGPYFYLQESYREGKSVRTRHIAYLGKDYQLAQMRAKEFKEGKVSQADLEREFGTGQSGKRGRPKAPSMMNTGPTPAAFASPEKMPKDEKKTLAEKVASHNAMAQPYSRDLSTCEDTGAVVVNKKTGKVVGTIVGSYKGGFQVKAASDGEVAMLPFASIDKFGVRDKYVPKVGDKVKMAEEDDIECGCGNNVNRDGFFPCDSHGHEVEPTDKDWPEPLVVCEGCDAIINTKKSEVVGVRSKAPQYTNEEIDIATTKAWKLRNPAMESTEEFQDGYQKEKERIAKENMDVGRLSYNRTLTAKNLGVQYLDGNGKEMFRELGRDKALKEEFERMTKPKSNGFEVVKVGDGKKENGGYWTVTHNGKGAMGRLSESEAREKAEHLNADYSPDHPFVGKKITSFNADGTPINSNEIILVDTHPKGMREGTVNAMLSSGHVVTMSKESLESAIAASEAKTKPAPKDWKHMTPEERRAANRTMANVSRGMTGDGKPLQSPSRERNRIDPVGYLNEMAEKEDVTIPRLEHEIKKLEKERDDFYDHNQAGRGDGVDDLIIALRKKVDDALFDSLHEGDRITTEQGRTVYVAQDVQNEMNSTDDRFFASETKGGETGWYFTYGDVKTVNGKPVMVMPKRQPAKPSVVMEVDNGPKPTSGMSLDDVNDEVDIMKNKYQVSSIERLHDTLAFHANSSTLAGDDAKKDRDRFDALMEHKAALIKDHYENPNKWTPHMGSDAVANDNRVKAFAEINESADHEAMRNKIRQYRELMERAQREGDEKDEKYWDSVAAGLSEGVADYNKTKLKYEHSQPSEDYKSFEQMSHGLDVNEDPDLMEEYERTLNHYRQLGINPEFTKNYSDAGFMDAQGHIAGLEFMAIKKQKGELAAEVFSFERSANWKKIDLEREEKKWNRGVRPEGTREMLEDLKKSVEDDRKRMALYEAASKSGSLYTEDELEAMKDGELEANARAMKGRIENRDDVVALKRHQQLRSEKLRREDASVPYTGADLGRMSDNDIAERMKSLKGDIASDPHNGVAVKRYEQVRDEWLRRVNEDAAKREPALEETLERTRKTLPTLSDKHLEMNREMIANPGTAMSYDGEREALLAVYDEEIAKRKKPDVPKKDWMGDHLIIAGVSKKPDIATRAKILGAKSLVQEVPEGQIWDTPDGGYILFGNDGKQTHMTAQEVYNKYTLPYLQKQKAEKDVPLQSPATKSEGSEEQIARNVHNMLVGGIASEKQIRDKMETEKKFYDLSVSKGHVEAAAAHKASYEGMKAALDRYNKRETIGVIGDEAKAMRQDWENSSNKRHMDIDGNPNWRLEYVGSNISDAQEAMRRGDAETAKHFLKMAQYNNERTEGFNGANNEAQKGIFDMWNMVMYDRNASRSKDNKGKSFDTIANETKKGIFEKSQSYRSKRKVETPIGDNDYGFYREEADLGVKASHEHEWDIVAANSIGYYILKGVGRDEEAKALKESAEKSSWGGIKPEYKAEADAMVKKARNERAAMVMAYCTMEDSNAHTENRAWTDVAKLNGTDILGERREPKDPRNRSVKEMMSNDILPVHSNEQFVERALSWSAFKNDIEQRYTDSGEDANLKFGRDEKGTYVDIRSGNRYHAIQDNSLVAKGVKKEFPSHVEVVEDRALTGGVIRMYYKDMPISDVKKLKDDPEKVKRDEEGRKAAEDFVNRKKGRKKNISTSGGNYITEYRFEEVEAHGKKYHIPVTEDGTVPEEFLVMRYLEVEEGNRGPGTRNPIIDSSVDAEIIIPKNAKAKDIAKWWAYPNESDIKDLDTTSARLWDVGGAKGKGSKEANRKIAIVGGTKGDHDAMREIISKSFTVKEQKQMGGTTIFITDIPNAGEYHGRFAGTGYLIKIQRAYAKDPSTVTHELVHHLRAIDPNRDGVNKRPNDALMDNRDRDLEEAATEAETVTRHKNFKMHRDAGYYQQMKDGPAKRREDRGLFTNKTDLDRDSDGLVTPNNPQLVDSGIKGKRSLKSVDGNFKDSNIAHLKWNQKKVEAIDRYYEVKDKNGKTVGEVQAYNPQGKDVPPAMDVPEGGSVNEWKDGKRVPLDEKK